jgi:hypothetical protein
MGMASRTSSTDEVLSRLLLDIKALMLLSASDGSLPDNVKEKIVSSHDEQISAFVSMINTSSKKKTGVKSALFTALSEMVLAAILAVIGLALLAPSIVGLGSQSQLEIYFDQIISSVSARSLSNPIVPAAEFIIAIVLLIGAFYNLRTAAETLRAIEPPQPVQVG